MQKDWKKELLNLSKEETIFLGVGNELKSDDGVAKAILSELKTENKIYCSSVPENFISKIQSFNPKSIVIIDAIDFQAKPGEIIFSSIEELEKTASISTHSSSFSLFCKFFPNTKIYLLGIQPKSLEMKEGLSKEVKTSSEELIKELNKLF